jgi:hypothetical protein
MEWGFPDEVCYPNQAHIRSTQHPFALSETLHIIYSNLNSLLRKVPRKKLVGQVGIFGIQGSNRCVAGPI